MSFIDADEFIILMDLPTNSGREFSLAELGQLRKAGIRTAWLHGLDWNEHRQRPGYLSKRIERIREAGMKALVPLWCWHPSGLKEEWYARTATGMWTLQGNRKEFMLSPWNPDAQRYYNEILARVKREYEAEDVQIVSIYCRAGESVMPNGEWYWDEAAIRDWKHHYRGMPNPLSDEGKEWLRKSYLGMILEQQKICIDSPWREAWFGYHLPKQGRPVCGVDWFEDYLQAILTECAPVNINHITFTYFYPYAGLAEGVEHLKTAYGSTEWAGAEYCEGLKAGNAEKALEAGLRGLILAPCHPLTRHEGLAEWMVREVERAIDLYQERKAEHA